MKVIHIEDRGDFFYCTDDSSNLGQSILDRIYAADPDEQMICFGDNVLKDIEDILKSNSIKYKIEG